MRAQWDHLFLYMINQFFNKSGKFIVLNFYSSKSVIEMQYKYANLQVLRVMSLSAMHCMQNRHKVKI